MISVTFRIFGSSSTARIQWGEVREMSVIVIWVQSPVNCASGEYDPRTPCATGGYSVTGSVSVNLTDDCRELVGNAAETNYRSARVGKRPHRNRRWLGTTRLRPVENSERSCRRTKQTCGYAWAGLDGRLRAGSATDQLNPADTRVEIE